VKDFSATIKLYNNQLKQRRAELGMTTRQISEALGISLATYLALERLGYSPWKRAGEWTRTAMKIAEFHGLPPEELFPEAIKHLKATTQVAEFNFDDLVLCDMDTLPSLMPSPLELMEGRELRQGIADALKTLTPREERVLTARLGLDGEKGKELGEVGQEFSVSRERIRQIEMKAIKKLRHPTRAKRITVCMEEGDLEEYGRAERMREAARRKEWKQQQREQDRLWAEARRWQAQRDWEMDQFRKAAYGEAQQYGAPIGPPRPVSKDGINPMVPARDALCRWARDRVLRALKLNALDPEKHPLEQAAFTPADVAMRLSLFAVLDAFDRDTVMKWAIFGGDIGQRADGSYLYCRAVEHQGRGVRLYFAAK